jgi:hypothetical protein
MVALRLRSKVHMLGRHYFLPGCIYKSNLNEDVFCNLKPVNIYVACITEQNVTQDRTLYKGTNIEYF